MISQLLSPITWRGNTKLTMHRLIMTCMFGGILTACNSDNDEAIVEETPVVEAPALGATSQACLASGNESQVTDAGIEYLVTPDACFDSLSGYDFAAHYVEIEGLRMHYVDEGPQDGEVVLMLHGQPSWSYLYRKMIPILAQAGYRVIAPDHIGMGKSDKPVDVSIHQFERHVAWTKAFINKLQLTDINLFVQDWGSVIGLRVAGNMPDKIARLTVANGDLVMHPPGNNPYTYPSFEIDESLGNVEEFFDGKSSDNIVGFQQWIDYAATAPNLKAGDVLQQLTTIDLSEEEVDAYNAPYPDIEYKAAIRSFPAMMTGIEMQNLLAWQTLGAYHNPFMFNAGEHDQGLGSMEMQIKWTSHVPGAQGNDHRRFDAGHFIQDDVGEDLALHLLDFMQTTTVEEPLVAGGTYFNFRYCEVLLPYLQGTQVIAEVWGTPGVGFCPQSQWDALDFDQISADNGALTAIPNGPRFFIMDESLNGDLVGDGGTPQFKMFGDINMRLLTTADLSVSQGESEKYVPGLVSRDNIWVYYAGRRVYELTDENGQVYVMQSFSRITDPDLQIDDLKSLGDSLNLPAGWTFSSRVLSERLEVSAVNGIASVIKDDLDNSYQLLPSMQ
ncbi:haloalkane dehalogenase [Thalassomonas actiniarum]|uniref:Alpha/beta fold hydrolase n=1 Tax=Thalassomonas actiniarum TaxID=485447 RepID=A0AAE9YS95_9GAMM|nr:haloalkane dehalogenase [Thalassomonas actiniarum]WDE00296.1 alpha/beta fold hydrolase [Thalassomonas actiniarum]